jgi:hypothetical protein
MSRNQPGARAPLRRHPADQDPYANPTAPQGQWPAHPAPQQQHGYQPPPAGYDQYGQPSGQAPQQGQNFYFPQGGDADPNYGYTPRATGQPPAFERFPPPPAPGYGQQPPPAASPQWNHQQQHEARNFDLGSYMPAGGQGYASPEAGHLPPEHQAFDGHPGYNETDGEYEEPLPEEEEPRRGRRGLMIVGALVGAIGLGGALAYTYKTFIATSPSRAPLVKATDPAANKVKPVVAGGKEFAHQDKKLVNRLGEDGQRTGAADNEQQDERTSDDPNAPRKVRIIPITPGGPQAGPVTVGTPPPAKAPMAPIPGITLDVGPPQAGPPPAAQRAQIPAPQAGPPARPVAPAASSQPPVKIVASSGPVPIAAEPAPPKKVAAVVPKEPAAKAPVVKTPVAKTKETAPAQPVTATSGTNGFVAVLSSQKSRMDALKAFADLQQKYGDVLAARTPDVQEANLGEKGVWYRAVVGPPGSRDAATGVCTQLKTAGYSGCWVAAY